MAGKKEHMTLLQFLLGEAYVRSIFFVLTCLAVWSPFDFGGVIIEPIRPPNGSFMFLMGFCLAVTLLGVLFELAAMVAGVGENYGDYRIAKWFGVVFGNLVLVILFGFGKRVYLNNMFSIFIFIASLSMVSSMASMLLYRVLVIESGVVNLSGAKRKISLHGKKIFALLAVGGLIGLPSLMFIMCKTPVTNRETPMYTVGGYIAESLRDISPGAVILILVLLVFVGVLLFLANSRKAYAQFGLFVYIPIGSLFLVATWMFVRLSIPFLMDPLVLFIFMEEAIILSSRYAPAILELLTASIKELTNETE